MSLVGERFASRLTQDSVRRIRPCLRFLMFRTSMLAASTTRVASRRTHDSSPGIMANSSLLTNFHQSFFFQKSSRGWGDVDSVKHRAAHQVVAIEALQSRLFRPVRIAPRKPVAAWQQTRVLDTGIHKIDCKDEASIVSRAVSTKCQVR